MKKLLILCFTLVLVTSITACSPSEIYTDSVSAWKVFEKEGISFEVGQEWKIDDTGDCIGFFTETKSSNDETWYLSLSVCTKENIEYIGISKEEILKACIDPFENDKSAKIKDIMLNGKKAIQVSWKENIFFMESEFGFKIPFTSKESKVISELKDGEEYIVEEKAGATINTPITTLLFVVGDNDYIYGFTISAHVNEEDTEKIINSIRFVQ